MMDGDPKRDTRHSEESPQRKGRSMDEAFEDVVKEVEAREQRSSEAKVPEGEDDADLILTKEEERVKAVKHELEDRSMEEAPDAVRQKIEHAQATKEASDALDNGPGLLRRLRERRDPDPYCEENVHDRVSEMAEDTYFIRRAPLTRSRSTPSQRPSGPSGRSPTRRTQPNRTTKKKVKWDGPALSLGLPLA